MDPTMLLIILVGLTVAAAGWAVASLVLSLVQGDRGKLQERLSGQGRMVSSSGSTKPAMSLRRQTNDLPTLLNEWNLLRGLNERLAQAYPDITLGRFLGIAASMAALSFLAVYLISQWVVASGLAAAAAGALPFMALKMKRSRRQRMLTDQLPDALEFLSRVLRAGHSLTTGFQMMGDELPDPLATEFRRCYDQHSLGQPLEVAMKEMAARVQANDVSFFVTAVLIQRQTGGDLAEVLDKISTMVRNRIRLQQHVRALTAEGRATGYVLVALPAVLFAIMFLINPEYMGQLIRTQVGRIMLAAAFGLQVVGMVVIRRIVAVVV